MIRTAYRRIMYGLEVRVEVEIDGVRQADHIVAGVAAAAAGELTTVCVVCPGAEAVRTMRHIRKLLLLPGEEIAEPAV